MAGTTPRGYPTVDSTDPDNGPAQITALATAIDTDVTQMKALLDTSVASVSSLLGGNRVLVGSAALTGGPSWSYTRAVAFGTTFSSAPRVWISIPTSAGGTDQIDVRPTTITTSGFSAWLHTWDHSNLNNFTGTLPIFILAIGPA